ncbi:sulfurtransferase TusA family protein [Salinirubellus salinus]|uniref:Sulfurtransferase TusA family protein n=1 Tax=Salinirubellus salinus TaxID=1364945 RepID=A0A9E7UCS9_9EURY|nr:sulfurtransferase TusA family protein [Salinirubellus salinus]UWM56209.1 sulfurtransferase TusA family protein [Salinirubellus salinus]
MTSESEPTEVLDVKGESCPMPVVKTKQAVDGLESGALLEVLATDSGSVSDISGWAEGTEGVTLEEQSEREDGGETVYVHHVRVA